MRTLTAEERSLLLYLMRKAGLQRPTDTWLDERRVEDLRGDGVRSGFVLNKHADRDFDNLVSDVDFTDVDGIHVLASLFVDRNNNPYEVEIWKVDDTPLLVLPVFPNP
ncbi:hypothetical protein [Luteibacter sp. SG786]|uniref:DUF6984 family protein n=1 Tax=Luteibacter sp. SG786 TaxID=2587130 RepID=UPI0014209EF0|nr:hypothetical protein [Luteibacter sp. SG786]NII52784.1 hypothetical protein [Luteibacter sp. SG786]